METRLHFSRFEFKYILPQSVRDDLESELQYFLELDPYVATKSEHKYFVRSLYYDNRAMVCYYEKIDGMMVRAKFRLRTYTGQHDEACAQFLEIKGRYNALVFKHRSELLDSQGEGSDLGGESLNGTTRGILRRLEEGDIKSQFLRGIYRKDYVPVMLIDYMRRPYYSKYDPEFRLTFDDSLSGCVTDRLFPKPYDSRRRILPGFTIVEVKFRHHVPKWFHRIIQAFELRRVSVSKYCAGVDAHGLVPKLE